MAKGGNESAFQYIQTSVKHHVVSIVFCIVVAFLFLLSSSTTIRVIAYGAGSQHSFHIVDRPLRGVDLSVGWLTETKTTDGCVALPEEVTTKRVGFPFYYQKYSSFKPCGEPDFAFNVVGFFMNSILVLGIGVFAGLIVRKNT